MRFFSKEKTFYKFFAFSKNLLTNFSKVNKFIFKSNYSFNEFSNSLKTLHLFLFTLIFLYCQQRLSKQCQYSWSAIKRKKNSTELKMSTNRNNWKYDCHFNYMNNLKVVSENRSVFRSFVKRISTVLVEMHLKIFAARSLWQDNGFYLVVILYRWSRTIGVCSITVFRKRFKLLSFYDANCAFIVIAACFLILQIKHCGLHDDEYFFFPRKQRPILVAR